MSVNIERINKLNELVNVFFRNKHLIVLEPTEKRKEISEENIVYDVGEWKIPKEFSEYISELSNKKEISIEEKILSIYEKICKEYVYDDNLISYIQKIDDDTFSLPDWYGRDIDKEWEKNREKHNRRICFELSRYVAKSLKELLKDNENYDTCIFWNKNLTHYFVGLICDEYSLSLDLDDFFKIKDLTRLKANLTAEGIEILEDKDHKFKNALKKFNEGKSEHAIKRIEEDINENKDKKNNNNNGQANKDSNNETKMNDEVLFFEKVMEVLTEKYNLDSQGIFEYMKEIVDIRLGQEGREKVWKRIDGQTNESTRYIRCLILNIDNKKYLVDVDKAIIRPFNERELYEKRTHYIPYKELSRGGFDYYDGT